MNDVNTEDTPLVIEDDGTTLAEAAEAAEEAVTSDQSETE